jgi:ribonuclease HI
MMCAALLQHSLLTVATWTLQFDGSLRHPSDPGVPTRGLGQVAACAACITYHDHQNKNGDQVRRLGGKRLSVRSSGEAEYEGLLFGLDGLREYLALNGHQLIADSDHSATRLVVRVEGDCKTVIEQMKGAARSRKLAAYHQRASAAIRSLDGVEFEFHHTPRQMNVVCDRACARISQYHEDEAYRNLLSDVQAIYSTRCENIQAERNSVVKSPGGSITKLIERHFQPYKSLIPYSKRPSIYRMMAQLAHSSGDFAFLLTVGERFQSDLLVATVRASSSTNPVAVPCFEEKAGSVSTSTRDILLLEAILCQIIALEALGRPKEALHLRRKKRYLLKVFEREVLLIEEFITGSSTIAVNGITNPGEDRSSCCSESWTPAIVQWWEELLRSNFAHSWVDFG